MSCRFKFLKSLLTVFMALSHAGSIPEEPPLVKAVPAVYLRRLSPITTYESTIPLFFKIDVQPPPKSQESSKCEPLWKVPCEIAALMRVMVHEMREDLLMYESTQQDLSKPRKPRQIGIALAAIAGFTLRPIVSKLSHGLFGDDEEMAQYINKVRDSLAKTDKAVVQVEHDLVQFSNFVQNKFDVLQERLSHEEKLIDTSMMSILQLLVAKLDTDRLHNTVSSCQNKFIPSQILPHKVLAERLQKLEVSIKKQNHELAIPVSRLSEYLKLPLADCMFSESFAWVMVNVPIRQVGPVWNLFEIIHSKFAFEGQTCEIYPKDVSYLAVSGTKTIILNSHILRHCSVTELGICLIPPHTRDSSQSLECAVGMLGGKSVRDLSKACAFRCSTNTELVINQLEHNKVLITNAKEVNFVCKDIDKSRAYKFDLLGAVEVTLKCNCVVYANHEPINPPFPCIEEVGDTGRIHEIFHVIPDLWTSLHTAVGLYGLQVHSGHIEILSTDWNTRIPVFNFSVPVHDLSVDQFELPDRYEAHRGPWYLHYVLFGILLLIIVLLIIVLCCYFKFRKA